MGALHKRIAALEGVAGSDCWAGILDRLSDTELDRLESLVCDLGNPNAAEMVETLSDADACFLARVVAMKG